VIVKTGIPECDAYGGVIGKLLSCDKLPPPVRDAMKMSFDAQLQGWFDARPDQIGVMAAACKQSDQGMRQTAIARGCTI
jgi:hypothetical protein